MRLRGQQFELVTTELLDVERKRLARGERRTRCLGCMLVNRADVKRSEKGLKDRSSGIRIRQRDFQEIEGLRNLIMQRGVRRTHGEENFHRIKVAGFDSSYVTTWNSVYITTLVAREIRG